jgi:hypothetical protein
MPPQLPVYDSTETETYDGTCHCGTVQYSVTLCPPLEQMKIVEGNCTMCTRHGYLLVYPPRKDFKLKSGEDALKDYKFGMKRVMHKFCGNCGCMVFFDPQMVEHGDSPPAPDIVGLNVS